VDIQKVLPGACECEFLPLSFRKKKYIEVKARPVQTGEVNPELEFSREVVGSRLGARKLIQNLLLNQVTLHKSLTLHNSS
jgi:hypothetical protein